MRKSDVKTELIAFRMTKQDALKLRQAAHLEMADVSDIIREAIDHYLASLPHPPDATSVPIAYVEKREK